MEKISKFTKKMDKKQNYENSNFRTQSPEKWMQVFSQPHIAESIEHTLKNNEFGLGTENHPIYSFEDLGLTHN